MHGFVECDAPHFVNARLSNRDGLDRRRDAIGGWPAEDASADQRERDAARAQFVGDLQGAPVTRHQQGAVALSGVVVRADCVDDPPGRQVACCCPSGVAGGEAVRKPGDAVTQNRRASDAMDRAVHTAASAHSFVRRIDDGVNVLRRDVTENGGGDWHGISLPGGTDRAALLQ